MLSRPLIAHHGTAAYDTSKVVTVKGTMADFRFVNPHVQLFFDVKNEKGETEHWQAELTAPNKLSRAGWDKHTLKPGDLITDETAVQAAQPSGAGGQRPAEPHGPPVQGNTRHAERGQRLAQVSEHTACGCRRGGRPGAARAGAADGGR